MSGCFLDQSRECNESCEAYLPDLMPSCVFVSASCSLLRYLDYLRRVKTTEIKYPVSPPAPEVR